MRRRFTSLGGCVGDLHACFVLWMCCAVSVCECRSRVLVMWEQRVSGGDSRQVLGEDLQWFYHLPHHQHQDNHAVCVFHRWIWCTMPVENLQCLELQQPFFSSLCPSLQPRFYCNFGMCYKQEQQVLLSHVILSMIWTSLASYILFCWF